MASGGGGEADLGEAAAAVDGLGREAADAVADLLPMLNGRLGALSVFPLFPKEGVAAKRVILQGIKGSRAPLRLLPGMVLHEADGSYTRQAMDVLREAKPLDLYHSVR